VVLAKPGRFSAAGMRERVFSLFDNSCHRPRRRAIQYSRDSRDRAEKPRRTGCPACAGHDSGVSSASNTTPSAASWARPRPR
jgi:hypothetical protein